MTKNDEVAKIISDREWRKWAVECLSRCMPEGSAAELASEADYLLEYIDKGSKNA